MVGENRSGRPEGQPVYAPFTSTPHKRPMPAFFRIFAPAIAFAAHSIQTMNIHGLSSLPTNGPILIVSNHTAFLDPLTIGVPLFQAGLSPHFAAKADLFTNPVLGWILRQAGQIPIHRRVNTAHVASSDKVAQSLADMDKALDDGKCVCIFPEGTFTHDPDGWAMRARTGAARLALAHPDVPVIPVVHWGNERQVDRWTAKINWRLLGRRTTKVDIHVCPPIDLSAYYGREVTRELLYEVSDLIMNTINDELEEIRQHDECSRGVPRRATLWEVTDESDPLLVYEERVRIQARAKRNKRNKRNKPKPTSHA